MTDTTWRDVYDDSEGMACALEEIEKWLIARSYHPDASTVDAAAACIRELAERIAELEDQPAPAPEGERLREAIAQIRACAAGQENLKEQLALRVRTIRAAADEIERILTPERPGQEGGE